MEDGKKRKGARKSEREIKGPGKVAGMKIGNNWIGRKEAIMGRGI